MQIFGNTEKLHWNVQEIFFQSNTIETLENTGDIQLITNSIRNKLINYKRSQDQIKTNATINNNLYLNSISYSNRLFGGIDYFENIQNQPKLLHYFSDEKKQIEFLLSLEAAQSHKGASESQSSEYLKNLKLDIDEITKLINEEIK